MNSKGIAENLAGPAFQVPQSLGTTAGNNLFHSFSRFNIQSGESATFTGSDSLKNVISRVTGGTPSTINGVLRSTIGKANFYFINPAGVIFGANAKVDIPAAFHASTANAIRFADNQQFIATTATASGLSIAEPVGFGFLGNQAANVEIQNSHLFFDTNSSVSVSGKDVIINKGWLINRSGNIQLYTVGNTKVDIDLQKTLNQTLSGTLTVDSGILLADKEGGGLLSVDSGTAKILNNTTLKVNNSGPGNSSPEHGIQIAAHDILVDNSKLLSNATSTGTGADIVIRSPTGQLALQNGASINSSTDAGGDSGNIRINANNIELTQNSAISNNINAAASGKAGILEVNSKTLKVLNGSSISSNTKSSATAGAIKINSGDVNIVNGSQIMSSTDAIGNAGDVTVTANRLLIDGQNSHPAFSGIFSDINSQARGHGGLVKIKSDNITLINEGTIRSRTQSLYTTGKAGNVVIDSKSLLLDSDGRISSDTNPDSNADAGTIKINSDKLTILNQAAITSNTYSAGNAGDINVQANQVLIDGQNNANLTSTGIFSAAAATSTGNGGSVTVTSADLTLLKGGTISSSTIGKSGGKAGEVNINAHNIVIDGKSSPQYTGIFSDSYANLDANGISQNHGDANKVSITAKSLSLLDGGEISSSTWSHGKAGDVNVKVGRLIINGKNTGNNVWDTGLFAAAKHNSSGQSGNITVIADQAIQLINHGKISIQNDATVSNPAVIKAGVITVSAPDIDLNDSSITTAATGNVNAGNIEVNFSHWLTMDPSFITTTATDGNGGAITVRGGELIHLQNSGFLTSVSGANGNGGNINISAHALVMDNGVIQANAVAGSGGDINLNLKALIPSQNRLVIGGSRILWQPYQQGLNIIQAASESGVNGSINLTSPQFDISGSISGLDSAALALPTINSNQCQGLAAISSLLHGGTGGIPANEAKSGFIAPATTQNLITSPGLNLSSKNSMQLTSLSNDNIQPKGTFPCATLSP